MPTSHEGELAFVNSHTIHHNAIVGVRLNDRGTLLPGGSGLGPATPHAQPACAH